MKFVLIADDKKHLSSFFPLWQQLGFVFIVLALLIALYPRHLLENSLAEQQASLANLNYLQYFATHHPEDTDLMILLIEQEIQMDQFEDALHHFSKLKEQNPSPSLETQLNFRWIEYLIVRYKAYQNKPNTRKRIAYLKQLRALGLSLSETKLSARQLRIIAQDNIALGKADVALKIYNHLMQDHQLITPSDFEAGANVAMQNNAHLDTSKFYWAAYLNATDPATQKRDAINAIKALWAGNLPHEGLALAKTLPDSLINDRETLIFLLQLALACNQPDVAQTYALKALLLKDAKKPHD